MSKPRRKPPARKESRGRTYTISCTDEQWAAIQDGAERAGEKVSPWFVGLCCKPDVGVSQIRTTTVLSSCFCVGQTVL